MTIGEFRSKTAGLPDSAELYLKEHEDSDSCREILYGFSDFSPKAHDVDSFYLIPKNPIVSRWEKIRRYFGRPAKDSAPGEIHLIPPPYKKIVPGGISCVHARWERGGK